MAPVNKMQKVLGELKALTVAANTELDGVASRNRPSMAIAKADAVSRLAAIETEYKQMLKDRAFVLYVYGDATEQAKFGQLAADEGDAVVVRQDALYERLADAVEPAIGAERQFGGTALGHLIREIENAARDSGTGRLTEVPRLRDINVVRTRKDVVDVCREIVLRDTGHTLNKDYVEYLAFKKAFEEEQSGELIPVVVLMSQVARGVEESLFNGRGIEVDAMDVDKEFVMNTFRRVKDEVLKAKK